MSKEKNKTYTTEFKQSAVELANKSDVPVAETARNLGVNENTLYTWIHKYSQPTEIKKKTERTDVHLYDELQQLKRENARLRQERDFLKKAAANWPVDERVGLSCKVKRTTKRLRILSTICRLPKII